jgi:hypothetical protein
MKTEFRIFLDMDGVIYNWMESGCKLFNVNTDDQDTRKILKKYHDGLEVIIDKQKVFQTVEEAGSSFWENLNLYPWSKKLYSSLCDIAPVTILTSPGMWSHAYAGKIAALKRDFNINHLILAKNKYLVASPNTLLIDDKKKNIKEFRDASGWGWVWPNSFCIEDKEIDIDSCISECLVYAEKVKYKVNNRDINSLMDICSHDNDRHIDLSE